MREGWERSVPDLEIDAATMTGLIRPAFPAGKIEAAEKMIGGRANANYRLAISGRDRPILLRLFLQDPASAPKEAAIAQWVADRVPVAQFLYFSPSNPATGHPYALLDWVEGERLEIVAADVGTTDLSDLGQAVGEALAGIGSFTFPEPGFLDGELGIAQPFRLDSRGYLAFLDGSLADEHLPDRLAVDLTNQLLEFAHREAPRLDGIDPTPRLVHSDFGGSNIPVERRSGRWSVSAVLDWKFAFSGTPILDIGNLLRPPLGRLTAFETAFIQTFAEHGGALPGDWRRLSRFADLLAWVAFLKRPAARPRLIADARGMIEGTLQDWESRRQ